MSLNFAILTILLSLTPFFAFGQEIDLSPIDEIEIDINPIDEIDTEIISERDDQAPRESRVSRNQEKVLSIQRETLELLNAAGFNMMSRSLVLGEQDCGRPLMRTLIGLSLPNAPVLPEKIAEAHRVCAAVRSQIRTISTQERDMRALRSELLSARNSISELLPLLENAQLSANRRLDQINGMAAKERNLRQLISDLEDTIAQTRTLPSPRPPSPSPQPLNRPWGDDPYSPSCLSFRDTSSGGTFRPGQSVANISISNSCDNCIAGSYDLLRNGVKVGSYGQFAVVRGEEVRVSARLNHGDGNYSARLGWARACIGNQRR